MKTNEAEAESSVDKRLKNRADFKSAQKVFSHTPGRRSAKHSEKIQRYRLAMLDNLKGRVAPSVLPLPCMPYSLSAPMN